MIKENSLVNADVRTVEAFGHEWNRFDQSGAAESELFDIFSAYFGVFPWDMLPDKAEGFDAGCGSGRWAQFVAPKVGKLHCVDASQMALCVAEKNLRGHTNCVFHVASVNEMPLQDGTMDFGYSLGVLHHLPDTLEGLKACAAKLKAGAPLLVYLYYSFDNRPGWFRLLWKSSDWLRQRIAKLSPHAKHLVADAIAIFVYLPLSRLSLYLEKLGMDVELMPLSAYRWRSFYSLRTDALDRFGTVLERRFTREEVRTMMETSGLTNVTFWEDVPYWCAVGYRSC